MTSESGPYEVNVRIYSSLLFLHQFIQVNQINGVKYIDPCKLKSQLEDVKLSNCKKQTFLLRLNSNKVTLRFTDMKLE